MGMIFVGNWVKCDKNNLFSCFAQCTECKLNMVCMNLHTMLTVLAPMGSFNPIMRITKVAHLARGAFPHNTYNTSDFCYEQSTRLCNMQENIWFYILYIVFCKKTVK